MTPDVWLRDVVEADLEVLFAQQDDPEANRRASFPARSRDAFMTHWHTRVLGDPTSLVEGAARMGVVSMSQLFLFPVQVPLA